LTVNLHARVESGARKIERTAGRAAASIRRADIRAPAAQKYPLFVNATPPLFFP
jgi:hypothetical protein